MDDMIQINKLREHGFYCSQILIMMGLDMQGKSNPDLVRSMQSLAGGIGFTGNICGALTGAACLLGLYGGKGKPDEESDGRLDLMLLDLVQWFRDNIGSQYAGVDCDSIIDNDINNMRQRCPDIILAVYQKSKDLLVEYGFELDGSLSQD